VGRACGHDQGPHQDPCLLTGTVQRGRPTPMQCTSSVA
jgi:hypothetical protein